MSLHTISRGDLKQAWDGSYTSIPVFAALLFARVPCGGNSTSLSLSLSAAFYSKW